MRFDLPFSSSLCPFSSLIFLLFLTQNHHSLLPLLKHTKSNCKKLFSVSLQKKRIEDKLLVNLPFFFVFLSLSFSLSPDV